jgi:hypothetical protein
VPLRHDEFRDPLAADHGEQRPVRPHHDPPARIT